MKILITNTVALNGGDAAILLSILNLLKKEFGRDTEFLIYDSQPEIARRYYSELKFRKLIYLQETDLPPMKFLGRSLLGRALRRLTGNILRPLLKTNSYRFYYAAWCWHNKLFLLSHLLLNKEELQDLKNYSSADLIISTGGTYLVESYSPLTARIFDYKLSLLLQRPLVFFTQSLGPFTTPQHQKIFKEIFNRSLLILLRDEASFKNLQSIQADTSNAYVSSDVVFSFPNEISPSSSQQIRSENVPLRVAISVRYWRHFKAVSAETGMQAFQKAVCAVTQYLVEKCNAHVTYISTCQGVFEYWTDDSNVAEEIVNSLPSDIQKQVCVDKKFHTPQELVEILKTYDLVVATRMHMAILSLVAGTPVFPIAYEFKTKELFDRLGMLQWVQDIEDIDAEALISSISEFIDALPTIRELLVEKVEHERSRAFESGKLVKAEFNKLKDKKYIDL